MIPLVIRALGFLLALGLLASAEAANIKDMGIIMGEPRDCEKGGAMKLLLSDSRELVLGENDRVVMMEPSNEGDGYPVVTLGVWEPATGEVTLHEKTRHKAQPGDSLCRDLFPDAS